MLFIKLPVVALPVPVTFTERAVTPLVPPLQLLKVLFEMVLVEAPASVLTHPAIVVAPVTVIFEKLLLLLLITLPDIDAAVLLVKSVNVPPALFVNEVTIEL